MKRIIALGLALSLTVITLPAHANWLANLFKDTYTETKYPIVLAHGMFGWDTILGIEYWYRIPEELRRSGAKVYVTTTAGLNSSEVRGEQLAREVERVMAISGAKKVHLIGHSHGGPTVRYVASVYPHYVASVSTVAGVNWGAPLADVLVDVSAQSGFAKNTLNTIANAAATLMNVLGGGQRYDQSMGASLRSLSTAGSVAFNALYPEGMPSRYCGNGQERASNGVRYYSWSGASVLTNPLDISDALMGVASLAMKGEKSDGMVSTCSSRLGKVIRDDYNMNHLDEVNQFLGLRAVFGTDPVSIYRQQANRLKNLGL